MSVPSENELYFRARDRALERLVEGEQFEEEVMEAFKWGLRFKELGSAKIAERLQSETNFAFSSVCAILARLEAIKGKAYAASWQRRGMAGAFSNLQRKYDRIDNIINLNADDAGENVISQLADMIVYGIKMIALQTALKPADFDSWLEEIGKLSRGASEADISS